MIKVQVPVDYQVEDRTEDCLEHSPSQLPQQQHHQHTRYTWLHPLDFQRNLQESTRRDGKKSKNTAHHSFLFRRIIGSIYICIVNYVL